MWITLATTLFFTYICVWICIRVCTSMDLCMCHWLNKSFPPITMLISISSTLWYLQVSFIYVCLCIRESPAHFPCEQLLTEGTEKPSCDSTLSLSPHSSLTWALLSDAASWLPLANNSLSGWEYDLIEQVSSLSLVPWVVYRLFSSPLPVFTHATLEFKSYQLIMNLIPGDFFFCVEKSCQRIACGQLEWHSWVFHWYSFLVCIRRQMLCQPLPKPLGSHTTLVFITVVHMTSYDHRVRLLHLSTTSREWNYRSRKSLQMFCPLEAKMHSACCSRKWGIEWLSALQVRLRLLNTVDRVELGGRSILACESVCLCVCVSPDTVIRDTHPLTMGVRDRLTLVQSVTWNAWLANLQWPFRVRVETKASPGSVPNSHHCQVKWSLGWENSSSKLQNRLYCCFIIHNIKNRTRSQKSEVILTLFEGHSVNNSFTPRKPSSKRDKTIH